MDFVHDFSTGGADMDIQRAALAVRWSAAEQDGKRRIRGVANSFSVMRSGRIIHPKAVTDWLARTSESERRIPLMAQHGLSGGLSTVGGVDRLEVDDKKGLLFEGTIADGFELANQAWALVRQGMLKTVSIGWAGPPPTRVSIQDKEVDSFIRRRMEDAGVEYADVVFGMHELVEVSLVDVPDDRKARLAAKAGAAEIEQAVAPLRAEVAKLRAQVARLATPSSSPEIAGYVAGVRELFGDFVEDFKAAALEALTTDPDLRDAARDHGEGVRELMRAAETPDTRDDLADLEAAVANFGKKTS